MNKINYQKELDKLILDIKAAADRPKLLLHSCCAPCSSYCLIYLKEYFDITCFFYNPNITDKGEYEKRLEELKKLAGIINEENRGRTCEIGCFSDIKVIDGGFETSLFFDSVKGLENVPEGGERCNECFRLRLGKASKAASEGGFDYFTTTLTISPLKNEQVINQLGYALAQEHGTVWLPSDFKKKGGYQESVRLSREYELYRQDYCGCVYSLRRDYVK